MIYAPNNPTYKNGAYYTRLGITKDEYKQIVDPNKNIYEVMDGIMKNRSDIEKNKDLLGFWNRYTGNKPTSG